MVDVSHDRHDGCARDPRSGAFAAVLDRARELHLLFEGDDRGLDADLAGQLDRRGRVERLVDGREHAALHEEALDVAGQHAELLGQLLDRDALREEHRAPSARAS